MALAIRGPAVGGLGGRAAAGPAQAGRQGGDRRPLAERLVVLIADDTLEVGGILS